MQIRAFRYGLRNSSEMRTWKFNSEPSSKASHLWHVIEVDEVQQKLLMKAFDYLLLASESPEIASVAIQLEDEASTIWTIERKKNKLTVLAGREKRVLSDQELLRFFSEELPTHFQKPYQKYDAELRVDAEQNFRISTNSYDVESEFQNQLKAIRAQYESSIKEQIYKLFSQPMLADDQKISNLRKRALPLLWSYKSLHSLQAHAKKRQEIVNREMQGGEEALFDQLELLDKVEALHSELTHPSNAPNVLRTKLDKQKLERENILKSCMLPLHTAVASHYPWDKLMQALAKKHALGSVVASMQRYESSFVEKLQKNAENHLSYLQKFSDDDRVLLEEIQLCLDQIHHFAKVLADQKNQQLSLGWIAKKVFKAEEEIASLKEDVNIGMERSKLAVDQVLTNYGELRGRLQDLKHSSQSSFEQIQENISQQLTEYRRAKETWQQLCKKYGLPTEVDISQFIQLVSQAAKLEELQGQIEKNTSLLSQRSHKLAELRRLVYDWRSKTKSQKDLPLENPEILIAEANSLLTFRSQKRKELDRAKQRRSHIETLKEQVQAQTGHLDQLKIEWKQLFDDLAVPYIDITHPSWDDFFQLASKLDFAKIETQNPSELGQVSSKWLHQVQTKAQLAFVQFSEAENGSLDWYNFASQLTTYNKLSFPVVIFTNDSVQAQALQRAGAKLAEFSQKQVQASTPQVAVPGNIRRQKVNDLMRMFQKP